MHYFSQSNEENKIEERISLGRNLDDGKWHGINIERKGSYTVFKVDQESATLKLADRISSLRIVSNLYLGGIPQKYLDPRCKETKEQFPRFVQMPICLDYRISRQGEKLARMFNALIKELLQ